MFKKFFNDRLTVATLIAFIVAVITSACSGVYFVLANIGMAIFAVSIVLIILVLQRRYKLKTQQAMLVPLEIRNSAQFQKRLKQIKKEHIIIIICLSFVAVMLIYFAVAYR